MTLNFVSVCPYCHKYVAPLRVGDTMDCPLCGGVSKLVIKTVSDEPKMKKIRKSEKTNKINFRGTNETQDKILLLCKEGTGRAWLSSAYFMKKIDKTNDTVWKNLKSLFDRGILERKAISRGMQFANGKSWQYYYRLKEGGGVI